MSLRVAIHGAAGRMGQRLICLAEQDSQLTIAAAVDRSDHPELGRDVGLISGIGEIGVALTPQLASDVGVVVDFSVPLATCQILPQCVKLSLPLVVATTGLDEEQQSQIREAARSIPIVWAPNMSLAVNVAMKLTAVAAEALKSLVSGVDVEIIERHHRYKEDAPSGTALQFGKVVADIMGQTQYTHGRQGRPGARPTGEIGYHAIRSGDNPGEHNIIFGMLGETVEVAVKATHRDCYASGALAAAKFVAGQPPGLYSMFDVLGIS